MPTGAARLPMSGPQTAPVGGAGIDALLPPGSPGAAVGPVTARGGQAASLPVQPTAFTAGTAATQATSVRPIVVPTQDAGLVTVREPVKRIGAGDDALELRSMTPEEKARWRFKKNLILWAVGLAIIGITVVVLLMTGPIRV